MLPDDVLLEIFDTYVTETGHEQEWHKLIHVCRRWRRVVFASSHRLNLRLFCTYTTPVKKTLRIWPEFPIFIWGHDYPRSLGEGAANIAAALEHRSRVCQIDLRNVPIPVLEKLAGAMQGQFPSLGRLVLGSNHANAPILPATFLAGSAPCLESLRLIGIPFLALPNLLMSATNLVSLGLWGIPHSGYIPPQAMATSLSALTRLKSLYLKFQSPLSRPDRTNRHLPPLTRVTLPALFTLQFKGTSEYFEALVAQIDAPQLTNLGIVFFHQLVFDTPQLLQFVCRTNAPNASIDADLLFCDDSVRLNLYSLKRKSDRHKILGLVIRCMGSDWQLSSLSQVCRSLSPLLSRVKHVGLCQDGHGLRPHWHDDMEHAQWLELLQWFTGVEDLCLTQELGLLVPSSLQELAREGVTNVLPALRSISIDGFGPLGPIEAAVIKKYVAPRQLSGRPVTLDRWSMTLLKASRGL